MNNVTPEHIVNLTQGTTPTQIVILVLLGIIALGVIVGIVKWVIDLKIGTLPADITEIRNSLSDLRTELATIQGKLWSKDDVRVEIKAAIAEHIEHCPFFHQDGRN